MSAVDASLGGYAIAAVGGFAGSLHCLGMCGAFPLALSARGRGSRVVRQLLYQLGRVNALVFIGVLSGLAGATLVAGTSFAVASRVLAAVAGGVMIALGVEMLGLVRGLTGRVAFAIQGAVARPLRGIIASSSPAAPVALGMLNAFLPCHLVYAFAAQAAASGTPVAGGLTMLAFGAGTVPALLALGLFGESISPQFRRRFDRIVAGALIAYGLVLVATAALASGGGHAHH